MKTILIFTLLLSALASRAAELFAAGPVLFQPAPSIVRPAPISSLASGDFNGDGNIDLVISGTNYVTFLPGRGDATFRTGPTPLNLFTQGFEVADYTGDGKVEAIFTTTALYWLELRPDDTFNFDVPNTSFGRGQVVMGPFYTNRANPTFILGKVEIAAADFNNDGLLDYVTAGNSPSNATVFLNTNPGFAKLNSYNMGLDERTYSIAVGDWDRDGDSDLATANLHADAIGILYNDGAGRFNNPRSFPLGIDAPKGVVTRDMDGDGNLDLIARNDGGSLSLLVGSSNGSFSNGIVLDPGSTVPINLFSLRALTINDFNNDGTPDLAWIKGNEIRFLLNISPPRLAIRSTVDLLQIQWSTNFAKGARLESTTDLQPGAQWTEVQFQPIADGHNKTTFDSGRAEMRFFRLYRP